MASDTKPVAVLLVPEEGDPHGLLSEGPCGAKVPMMWQCTCGPRWMPCGSRKYSCAQCRSQGFPGKALVLAWEGKAVPEGLDRADRVLHVPHGHWFHLVIASILRGDHRGWPPFGALASGRFGTILLLDAKGREITP